MPADLKHRAMLQALLPSGRAWNRDITSELTNLLGGLSVELGRVEQRGRDLLDEIDPRTTTQLLSDWERVYGLPGQCGAPATIEGRRGALAAKVLGYGDPAPAYFVQLAAALGYDVTIIERTRADVCTCVSSCISSLTTRRWMFVWDVHAPYGTNNEQLQCLFRELAPSHTLVRFVWSFPEGNLLTEFQAVGSGGFTELGGAGLGQILCAGWDLPDPVSGPFCLLSDGPPASGLGLTTPVLPSTPYTVSFYYLHSSTVGAYTDLAVSIDGDASLSASFNANAPTADVWTRFSFPVTTGPDDSELQIQIVDDTPAASWATLFFAAFQLELGHEARAWVLP